MHDDRIDRDTAEHLLDGDGSGPPELAGLLAAASAGPFPDELAGEEAAVAAFRAASSAPVPQRAGTGRRLRARLLSTRAVLIALLLTLAGGVALAAASDHLPGSPGTRHPHRTHAPSLRGTHGTIAPPQEPVSAGPGGHASPGARHDGRAKDARKAKEPKRPGKTAHPKPAKVTHPGPEKTAHPKGGRTPGPKKPDGRSL